MMRFVKMHGLGNDFMVIDGVRQTLSLTPEQIRLWARRDTGIGFDQCLVVEASTQTGVDFFYRVFNASGEEVGQCGNGARCLARFIHFTELSQKNPLIVATQTTQMTLAIEPNEAVTVTLPPPSWLPAEIPCAASEFQASYTIPVNDQTVRFHAVSVGNPHAVIIVQDVDNAPVHQLGKAISEHSFFPEQVNVGFLQISAPGKLRLRVYERGCGETRACGSGAVAAAVVARRFHQQPEKMTVSLQGGDLVIYQTNESADITMTGSASFVYQGELLS